MMKYVMAVLMLLVFVMGCAPVTTAPPTSAIPPTTTPPVVPSTPTTTVPLAPAAVTPPPVAKVLSFEAETYTNEALGFTWQYPKKWKKAVDLPGDTVIKRVENENIMSPDNVGVAIVPEAADFSKAVKATIEAFPKFAAFHTKIDASPSNAITLADGKTFASESIATANINATDIYIYTVGFNKGGKTIIAWGITIGGGNSKAMIKEIAQTLSNQ
ncbi:MAG: hypothetical protein NTV42_04975 [Chloroflexi bacterium]|nr:hypothetical protein [Chloroflexota bacterium]